MRDLMGPERAIMVFTDPPYNVRISSVQGRGKIRHREFFARFRRDVAGGIHTLPRRTPCRSRPSTPSTAQSITYALTGDTLTRSITREKKRAEEPRRLE